MELKAKYMYIKDILAQEKRLSRRYRRATKDYRIVVRMYIEIVGQAGYWWVATDMITPPLLLGRSTREARQAIDVLVTKKPADHSAG